jgi:phosphatidate cytidylyltransferase
MLKTRVLSALLIALLTFAVIFFTPDQGFRLAISLLWMTGSWEFARLAALGRGSRWSLFAAQGLLIVLMSHFWEMIGGLAPPILAAAVICWLVMFLRLARFTPGAQPTAGYRLASSVSALASISCAWYALVWLRQQAEGDLLLLLLVFIIWAADTGAYFAGRLFGRHKLAPSISPGKTREGLLGGALLAVAVALLITLKAFAAPPAALPMAALTVVTVLVSAGGDLFISLHKRTVGLKDSGKVFPGHGGVLDRYDSLLAGAPFFALGIALLGS